MILSSYYNSINKCLVISKKIVENVTSVEINKDTYLVKNGDELVGINYFCEGYESGLIANSDIPSEVLAHFKENNISEPFCYGHILSCEAHPYSDKLKVCQVDLGSEIVQIVCGASNCTSQKIAVIAKIGAVMPNGMMIVDSKVHKVDSFGMMCSLKELGLHQEEPGIKLFEIGSKKVGSNVCKKDLI